MPEQPPNPVADIAGPAALDASPTEEDRARVGGGPGAPAGSWLVDDPNQKFRVEHSVHGGGPLPPEQASFAGQALAEGTADEQVLAADPADPPQDVRVMPDEPSVWEASPPDEEA